MRLLKELNTFEHLIVGQGHLDSIKTDMTYQTGIKSRAIYNLSVSNQMTQRSYCYNFLYCIFHYALL